MNKVLLNILDNKYFIYLIQILIIVSLITFSWDTLPNNSIQVKYILHSIERIIITIFTLEYVANIITSKHRIRFIFSFFGLIDLLAILPFYISIGVDLRSIRIFRLFRLIRILKLFKHNKTLMRFQKTFAIIKEELILFNFISAIILYISAVGIYHFEHQAQPAQFKSIFHSLWWSLTTLTTVGYGDMYPITLGGRLFTVGVLFVGLGIISIPTSLISSALTQIREEEKYNSKKQKE